MINNLLLKVSLTDGCTVAQDMLSIICPTNTPTPTQTSTPTPTPTVTPSSTPPSIVSPTTYILSSNNNYIYNVDNNIVARFVNTNTKVDSVTVQVPLVRTSAPNILSTASIIYQNQVIGQFQFDALRIPIGSKISITFALSSQVVSFSEISVNTPTINLT
jgi:hypothetical protein